MTQYININKHRIARNIKVTPQERDPVISVRTSKSGKAEYGNSAAIYDALSGRLVAEVIYDPDKPILKCGARLVIATTEHGTAEVGE